MKRHYVSDGVCVVALQGLRYVTKSDTKWQERSDYYLECCYKGDTKQFKYVSSDARDAMFDAISAELDKKA
jgi:hypothetical protein